MKHFFTLFLCLLAFNSFCQPTEEPLYKVYLDQSEVQEVDPVLSKNRINLIILGDGYGNQTVEELTADNGFFDDRNKFLDALFGYGSYKQYKDYFQVYSVVVNNLAGVNAGEYNNPGVSQPNTALDHYSPGPPQVHPLCAQYGHVCNGTTVANHFGTTLDFAGRTGIFLYATMADIALRRSIIK